MRDYHERHADHWVEGGTEQKATIDWMQMAIGAGQWGERIDQVDQERLFE